MVCPLELSKKRGKKVGLSEDLKTQVKRSIFHRSVPTLDGRNRTIVIAELLARVIAAIQITSVRWR